MAVTVIPVVEFLEYLSKNTDPYSYSDCDVISVTHSKNIDSGVKHEYLHVIIRHRPSNHWRRLLVERRSTQDQVIIGFWPWVARGGSADSTNIVLAPGDPKVPNPLLMRNISGFEPLNLQSVARVLVEVHRQEPEYRLLSYNCYWYSNAVFEIFRGMARGATYKEWPWVRLMRHFFFFPSSAFAARHAANQFKTLLPSVEASVGGTFVDFGGHLLRGVLGLKEDQEAGEPENFQSKVANIYDVSPSDTLKVAEDAADSDPSVTGKEALLHENKVSEKIILAMKEVDAISHLEEPAICSATEERKESINAFSNNVLANPDKAANLAFFESCLSTSTKEAVRDEPDPYVTELVAAAIKVGSANAPSEEEEARYDEAIRAFAGGILKQLRQDGVVF